jgi:hypothetical protein
MKKNEIKEAFMNKYSKELHEIFEKYDMDKGVCMNILVAWFRNLNNADKQYVYDFNGSKDVNLEELGKDIKELEDNRIIPRLEDGVWKL